MTQLIEVTVPDIGDYADVPVIEVAVKTGDAVKAEDTLITLESDKATMDVPSPSAGVVKDVKLKVGDKVAQGTLVLLLESAGATGGNGAAQPAEKPATPPAAPASAPPPVPTAAPAQAPAASSASIEVKVPAIGDFSDVPVIEIMVKPGDSVKAEDPLLTLESDKATMDIPAPAAGVVQSVAVKIGDRVSEGTLVMTLAAAGTGAAVSAPAATAAPAAPAAAAAPAPARSEDSTAKASPASTPAAEITAPAGKAHASPSVRKFARDLGVDVSQVPGSGPRGRILHDDVRRYVKGALSQAPAAKAAPATGGGGFEVLPWPKIDFAKFGAIETKPLSRIKKISGANLHRNWVTIPHVTNQDEADITDLETFRVQLNKEIEKSGVKVSMLAFLIKACVMALKKFPNFNASLDGENLVLKQYFHIGFAADTPNGLVVPVIRDADKKGIVDIAKEMSELAKLARDGKLKPEQMQGGCFSISSLGGIGGTFFTPIINAPEVAILGVCKSYMKPVWDGKAFQPRLTLPLSLSWDHRVIDGAEAARFNVYLAQLLADMRRSLL